MKVNVMDLGFRQGEESFMSAEKEDVVLICEKCGKEIREGELYEDKIFLLCERCAEEAFREELKEA